MCRRTLLSRGTLGLGGEANPHQSVLGLELLHGLGGVVDEGEAGGLAATVLGSETEDGDLVLLGLVEAAELLAELILGDVGAVGVEDVTEIASSQPKFPAMPGGPQSILLIKACPPFSSQFLDRYISCIVMSGAQRAQTRPSEKCKTGRAMILIDEDRARGIRFSRVTHTTICLRPSRGLRMNLRVRRVTGESLSAIFCRLS